MQAYRTETTLLQNGKLSIWGLPFLKGDAVEVIILTSKHKTLSERYPLRGKPYQFDRPFDSVSEDIHVTVV